MKFTEEHLQVRKMIREFVEKEINPHVDEWEREGVFPAHDLFPKLAAHGLLGLSYDVEYGGQGADYLFTVIFGEELGRADCAGVPMAIAVQTDMATPSLHMYGSHELKMRYLAPALRGEMVASIAVTEPDAGSDLASLRTRALREGDEWVINGSKLYITNGTQADWMCVLARTSDESGYRGMSQIIVPTDTPGFLVSRKLEKLGNWSSDTAELAFEDIRVPVANTIGEIDRGFQQQMEQFQVERIIGAAMAVGASERALERTRDYLKVRYAFDRPLLDNQYIQFSLAELAAELDIVRHYLYMSAEALDRGEDISRFATIAKLHAARLNRRVADTCMQFHGGFGYMAETWTSRYFRDSRLPSIGGGADEVMLRILARMEGFSP